MSLRPALLAVGLAVTILGGTACVGLEEDPSGLPEGVAETQAPLVATASTCTKDVEVQADPFAASVIATMKMDGSVWTSRIGVPAARFPAAGTDNKKFAVSSGQALDFCVIKNDDSMWCWGANEGGVVGNGTQTMVTEPYKVLEGVASATLARWWGCALKLDGTTWCWGIAVETGILGDGDLEPNLTPVQVMVPAARELSSGWSHACVVTLEGTVWCWGSNQLGSTGLDVEGDVPVPTQVVELGSDNVDYSAGSFSSCVTKTSGALVCWANIVGDGLPNARDAFTEVTGVGRDFVQFETRMHQACALKPDGSVLCWGDENPSGQLGMGEGEVHVLEPTIFNGVLDGSGTPVKRVIHGASYMCVILEDDSLWCLGGYGLPGTALDTLTRDMTEQDWCDNCDSELCEGVCSGGDCVACTDNFQCPTDKPFCDVENDGICSAEDPAERLADGTGGCGSGARCTSTPGNGAARSGSWLLLLGGLAAAVVLRQRRFRR